MDHETKYQNNLGMCLKFWAPSRGAAAILRNSAAYGEHRKEFQRQDPIFEGLHTRIANVTVLDPTDLFVTPKGLCRVAADGKALYWDNHHLTVAGAMMLRPLSEPIFAKGGEIQSLAAKLR